MSLFGEMYFSLGISIDFLNFANFVLLGTFLEDPSILSALLLLVELPVASAVFELLFFETVLKHLFQIV